jgi:hypothetical protein
VLAGILSVGHVVASLKSNVDAAAEVRSEPPPPTTTTTLRLPRCASPALDVRVPSTSSPSNPDNSRAWLHALIHTAPP